MTLAIALQYLLPHQTLSWLVRHATRWTWKPWKNFLIQRVVRGYQVDMHEAAESNPRAYPSFNAFFTRALQPDTRRIEGDERTLVSPADGRISQAGRIDTGRIVQAKGRNYTVAELLADPDRAKAYAAGGFATLYLSPRDYHRVHMPLAGRLVETVHVPGRLFSVAPGPVAAIPRLFARNERLVCHFEGQDGPFCVVLVGAMLVSGITTVWSGNEVPPYAHAITRRDWRRQEIDLHKMAELGRFEMGSTVIVLIPVAGMRPDLAAAQPIRVGQALGHLSPTDFHGTIP